MMRRHLRRRRAAPLRALRATWAAAQRLYRAGHRTWLRWQIRQTELYLRDCARDGLTDSLALREWHRQLQRMRVDLALLQEHPQ